MSEQAETNVGIRIRAMRERQGLSLRALAEQCGLSVNAISRIERGENSPTVSSLHRLADALGVPITDFFEEEQEQAVIFVKQDRRLRTQANGVIMDCLGIGLRDQQLEPFLITVAPGAGNTAEPITHPGEEFVYCFEGEINYYVSDQLYRLEAGDSLLFEATQLHCFHNDTDQPTRLMVVFQTTGAAHVARRRHLDS